VHWASMLCGQGSPLEPRVQFYVCMYLFIICIGLQYAVLVVLELEILLPQLSPY
jgi:hypothetical protein